MFARAAIYLSFFALLFAAACQEEVVPEIYHPRNDHEAYLHGLQKAGLATTALAKEWALHAQSSLSNPIAIELPFQEAFYFANTTPNAHAYGMTVRRGEKIQITLKSIGTPDIREQAKLFIDLFRIDSTDRDSFDHVASASKSENQLAFEPRQDAHYLIRIQPELLRGGRFEISIRSAPSLEFPVMGGNNRDIGSFFGDPRDGGRRKHHGIDIFARRHTPILAPCKGYIRFVGERGLGGKVVWMRDRQRDMTLYFAHLHEIIAKDDTWVDIGDTLGTVGNTGNARTTPPHLHFGIYSNGPIDPYHFVAIQKSEVKPIAGNLELLGNLVRTKRSTLFNPIRDEENSAPIDLDKYQWLQILGAIRKQYRVQLPAGEMGLVSINDIESFQSSIVADNMPDRIDIRDQVATAGKLIEEYHTKNGLEVLAKNESHWFIRTSSGTSGWIETAP